MKTRVWNQKSEDRWVLEKLCETPSSEQAGSVPQAAVAASIRPHAPVLEDTGSNPHYDKQTSQMVSG